MSLHPSRLVRSVTLALRRLGRNTAHGLGKVATPRAGRTVLAIAVLAAAGALVWSHPPLQTVARGEVGIRSNRFTGETSQWTAGPVLVLPGIHTLRQYNLRDQLYRPVSADGSAQFQSVEGLSVGVDVGVRYALDPRRLASLSQDMPGDIRQDIVQPAVQGVVYKTFTRYTVREIFSSKRGEIQQLIEAELKPKLAADGILLRSVEIGKVDLPADYKRGMERLLSEELESEKMRYTLELKGKRVQEAALDADAERVRREKSAEAAGSEQVIAAKAQEEAMRHVLPFKQKQIEQRQLEAEADKVSRIRTAEGSAAARRIEAQGEADSRQKLADAEAYRLDRVGKITSEQMARDGALVTRHPLLIQKIMADKLSDKIQVIIAAPPTDGGFIGSALLGAGKNGNPAAPEMDSAEAADKGAE
ncbi:hypothetical protein os1_05530 [Comamonadaceae bacterium OS-1]|nr:hypothetical protein os1_05530 [Comamonadaceae bacterium OS-1]